MKSLEELFEKEFKNLYALEKRINEVVPSIKSSYSKKLSKRLDKFAKRCVVDYEHIKNYTNDLSINPGNTTDSVANEILENLLEIDGLDIDPSVKEAGLLASLNRLASYKTTNYFNAYRMSKTIKHKKMAKRLKNIMNRNERHEEKFRKLAKKKIFKKALI